MALQTRLSLSQTYINVKIHGPIYMKVPGRVFSAEGRADVKASII